jgi:cytochrome c oxidase cbb3-type subunit 4
MDTYTFLRELADSWILLALTLFFLGVVVWAFRPGSRETLREVANIPLRDDTFPGDILPAEACANNCAGCTCKPALTPNQEPLK